MMKLFVFLCLLAVGQIRCEECEPSRVYDLTIGYLQDQEVDNSLLTNPPPLPVDRDTVEYRTQAFTFFLEQFGISVSVEGGQTQFINGGTAIVQGYALPDDLIYQTYSVDIQANSTFSNSVPVTNGRFGDDG